MADEATIGEPGVSVAEVRLPARLDSSAAVQLAGTLRGRLGADVVVDAADVDLLGARALEVLLVAAASWRADGHGFAVVNLPAGVRAQLSDLGLADTSLLEGAAP